MSSPHKLEIRDASRKELYTITVLTRKFFPYTGFNMEMIAKRLRNRNIHYLVALREGYTAGFIDFKENANSIKIMGLAVIPEMQGKGIGRKLVEAALLFAKKKRKEIVYLLVASNNSVALGMYGKFGFKLKGKLARQIWGQEVLLLKKELKPGKQA
ncbi:MAG TPA: GNAT family N-acetyltransferase [Candidatus Norongarragalinales archaeon]|nr:GNAT family N-acetyltransferase [Candidatus Norongarragalinales archaeon]